ncbi:MAG: tRNA (adenosine(37)-N6)-threonylcarbamoyltransferase complex dimerization subunit type 1 TsaB, partial [Pyrinomonadaceae bacterium]
MSVETHQFTVAIESAIRGGSISLIAGGVEIDNWIGSTEVSKAEDLLVDIDAMLGRNSLSISDIDHLAVSAGPGSFTGIRIGIATALGLKTGLGIPMSSVSALTAMAAISSFEGNAVVAVPVGRNAICLQTFSQDKIAKDEPRPVSFEE